MDTQAAIVAGPTELQRRPRLIDREDEIKLALTYDFGRELDTPWACRRTRESSSGNAVTVYVHVHFEYLVWGRAHHCHRQVQDAIAGVGRVDGELELRPWAFGP